MMQCNIMNHPCCLLIKHEMMYYIVSLAGKHHMLRHIYFIFNYKPSISFTNLYNLFILI